jgi:hypothetical protein
MISPFVFFAICENQLPEYTNKVWYCSGYTTYAQVMYHPTHVCGKL